MILSPDEIDRVLQGNLSREPIEGYAIRINGKTFNTDKGKMLWKKKHHAMTALKVALEYKLKQAIKAKLYNQGYTFDELWGDSEFIRAYDNFLRYLENHKLIEIIKVKWVQHKEEFM